MAPVLLAFIIWLLATGKAKDWVSLVVNLEYKPSKESAPSESGDSKEGKDWTDMGLEAWQLYRSSQTDTNTGKTDTDPFKVSGQEA